jgi:hypothetical protein
MAARQQNPSREALSRLPTLDIRELREEWRFLYKGDLARDVLINVAGWGTMLKAPRGSLQWARCLNSQSTPPRVR